MKFLSTDGRIHKVDLRPSKWPRREEHTAKSKFQYAVGQVIDSVFPYEVVLEEFYVPGDRLYIDFFLPRRGIAVEAHGQQHYKYNKYFHGTMENFKLSQARDRKKSLWCSFNDIRLVVIRHDDTKEEIVNKLITD